MLKNIVLFLIICLFSNNLLARDKVFNLSQLFKNNEIHINGIWYNSDNADYFFEAAQGISTDSAIPLYQRELTKVIDNFYPYIELYFNFTHPESKHGHSLVNPVNSLIFVESNYKFIPDKPLQFLFKKPENANLTEFNFFVTVNDGHSNHSFPFGLASNSNYKKEIKKVLIHNKVYYLLSAQLEEPFRSIDNKVSLGSIKLKFKVGEDKKLFKTSLLLALISESQQNPYTLSEMK